MTTTDRTWTPPGPGQWTASTDHYHRPPTPIMRELLEQTFSAGFRTTFAEMGAPLDTLDMQFVNGFGFVRPVAVVDKPGSKPPPDFILSLVCRIHPEFRRRRKLADRFIEEDTWRERADQWWDVERDRFRAENRALQAVDPGDLDNEALLAHVDAAIDHLRGGLLVHFEISPVEAAPFGMLCVRAADWGLGAEELLDVLVGASPATTAPSTELEPLRAELAAHGCAPTTLAEVRACSARAAELLDEWLRDRQWLVTTGYDLDDRTLGELEPVILVAIATTAPAATHPDPGAKFRAHVPEADRPEFDRLAANAREAFGLRDDNGPLTAEWPTGLLRRALLEVGARATGSGALSAADEATSARRDQLAPLLAGETAVGAAVADHHRARHDARLEDVPTVLGEPEPMPDPKVLPGSLETFARGATVILDLELAAARRLEMRAASTDDRTVVGVGLGEHLVRGRARVARTPDDLDDLAPGDIIVTPATAPTWNVVLAAASGLVVEEGGLTGHAAIVAREFGLPTLIGANGATRAIADGAEIELDTVAGEVRLIGASAVAAPVD